MPTVSTVTLNPVIDLIYTVPDFAKGSTVRARDFRLVPAGKGINVSYALACMREPSEAYLLLGEHDVHLYQQACLEQNISMHGFFGDFETRKHCTVLDPDKDSITHVQTRGQTVSPTLADELLHDLVKRVRVDDIVVLSGSIPPGLDDDVFARYIEACKEKGALTFLDSSGPALKHAAKAHPFLVKINQAEAEEMTGIRVQGPQEEYALLHQIHQISNIPFVVITFGKDGVIAGCRDGVWRMNLPLDPDEVVDTVGCGDAMMAGLVHGHWNRLPPEDIFRMGLVCASDAARHVGPGVIRYADLEPLQDRIQSQHIGTL